MGILSERRIVGAAAAIMLAASPAFGGAWTIPSGNVDAAFQPLSFSYSNGQDVNGLFGDPVIFGDAFFFATAFSAAASNGSSATQTDTVSVDVLANPGLKFGSITVSASGIYTIDTDATVDVSANLSMTENSGLGRVFADSLATFDDLGAPFAFPTSVPTGGLGKAFTGDAMVDVEFVFPVPSDDIHIELTNNILVISGAGGSATVNINFEQLRLGFNIIPEPASASLLLIGLVGVVSRRRRRC